MYFILGVHSDVSKQEMGELAAYYLIRLIHQIENVFSKKANKILIYMDGYRLPSKVKRPTLDIDIPFIRETFISILKPKYTIVYANGEAELEMYLKRDSSVETNLFITGDSDIIPITYNHEPKIEDSSFEKYYKENKIKLSNDWRQAYTYLTPYKQDLKITDSCIWINTEIKTINSEKRFIGLDGSKYKFGLNSFQFKILCASMGSDYTDSILSQTMINQILNSSTEFKEYVNTLDKAMFIVIAFVLYSLLKRARPKRSTTGFKGNIKELAEQYTIYAEYISSGIYMGERKPLNIKFILDKLLKQLEFDRNVILTTEQDIINLIKHKIENFEMLTFKFISL